MAAVTGSTAVRDLERQLQRVQAASVAEAEAEEALRAAVTAARKGGATWQQVARHLGVTRQAAAKRFGEKRVSVAAEDQPALF